MSSDKFRNVIDKMFTNYIHLIDMNEQDLALDNLQWLIYDKTQPTKNHTQQNKD